MCTCRRTNVGIHTHIHTHKQTYVYTHTQTHRLSSFVVLFLIMSQPNLFAFTFILSAQDIHNPDSKCCLASESFININVILTWYINSLPYIYCTLRVLLKFTPHPSLPCQPLTPPPLILSLLQQLFTPKAAVATGEI